MNGNANNQADNNIVSTIYGATLTKDRFDRQNMAYQFDGTDDYITLGTSSIYDLSDHTTPFTISLWVNTNSNWNSEFFNIGDSNFETISMQIFNSNFRFYYSLNGSSWTFLTSSWSWPEGTWVHVAVINDGQGHLSLYLNGNLANSQSLNSDIVLANLEVKVGAHYRFNNYFDGKLDDVKIYQRALTTSEIESDASNHENHWEINAQNTISYLDGAVAIGTANASPNYKLSVDGGAILEEVTVQLSDTWPDFVFNEDYNLLPLKEVSEFIAERNHLPDIPSAQEMNQKDGVDLGGMNILLLQKIEELTLYQVGLLERLELAEKEIAELKNLQTLNRKD